MLTLGRKKGEAIVIGGNIVVTVRDIGTDSVKLTIEAPRDIMVLRKELVEAARENMAAASAQQNVAGLAALIQDEKVEKKGE